jgi:serine/threonine protein kinase/WD40 repeat protein
LSNIACPSLDTLSAFLLGDLPETQLSEVAEHVAGCAACEEKASRLDLASDEIVECLRRLPNRDPEIPLADTDPIIPSEMLTFPPGTETWGEFRIVREIGRGGMGVVCEAYQGSLNRHVALKFLPEHGDLARFRREARAAGRLHHTNIVPVFGVGEQQGRHFYVMQYIAGRGLNVVLKERADAAASAEGSGSAAAARFDDREAARIGVQVADALAYAHAQGVIHRDIKPSNLLLNNQGTVWVTDLGLAHDASDTATLTQTGDFLGTLRYVAPERLTGPGDARVDVYSLGVTLYELACGRPAYGDVERGMLLHQRMRSEPPAPRQFEPSISRDLETIVLKAMAREPDGRYATAAALAADLRRFLDGSPIVARPVPFWERAWKWARRRPSVAALVVVLHAAAAVILATFAVSYVQIGQALTQANDSAIKARSAQREESIARERADEARNAALAETYRASLSEVRSLRSGRPSGWRASVVQILTRLARMPTPKRDLVDLRTEAVASLGEFDVVEIARLDGVPGGIYSFDFSPDSQTLATITLTGRVDFWSVPRRRHLASIPDPAGIDRRLGYPPEGDPRTRIKFLADGSVAYTAWDHRVKFVDASFGRAPRPPLDGGQAQALSLATDRRGQFIVVGWNDNRIELFDLATLKRRLALVGNPYQLAISPDGQSLAVSGPGETVDVVPTAYPEKRFTLGALREGWSAPAFSPDGARLGVATANRAVLWDVAGSADPIVLRGNKDEVKSLGFAPDGNLAATAGNDHTTRIWDVPSGQTVTVLPGPWFMNQVAFSPDGNYLAAVSTIARLTIYELQGRREKRRLAGHKTGADGVAFQPRSARLASGGGDRNIFLWDVDSCQAILHFSAGPTWVAALAFSPDGSTLASGIGRHSNETGPENPLRLWDSKTGSLQSAPQGFNDGVLALAFDPSGRKIAAGDVGGNVAIWDTAARRILRRETMNSQHVRAVAFLGDGRALLAGSEGNPGQIALIDLAGTSPTQRVILQQCWGRFVVDGSRRRIIVAGIDGSLTALSLPDLVPSFRSTSLHDGIVWSLALSADGRLLATGGADRRVVVRNPETFAPLFSLPPWTGTIKDLAFDDSSSYLALCGVDSDIAVWDLKRVLSELYPTGLAWDQRAPDLDAGAVSASAAESVRAPIPFINPSEASPKYYPTMDRPAVRTADSPPPEGARLNPSPTDALSRAIAADPKNVALWLERGNLYGRHRQWKAALEDITFALERDPDHSLKWLYCAPLYIELGDIEGYRRHAYAMLNQFAATSSAFEAERAAKIGLLLAPPEDLRRRLTDLADRAVTQGAGSPFLPWFKLVRGMAAYRDGEFSIALKWLEDRSASPLCLVSSLAFLAMSQGRLGDFTQARATLAEARRAFAALTPRTDDLGEAWYDWLIGEIALREAEAVILYDPVFPAQPFAP